MEELYQLIKELWIIANFSDLTTAEVFVYTVFGLFILAGAFNKGWQQGMEIREKREHDREKRKSEINALKRLNNEK